MRMPCAVYSATPGTLVPSVPHAVEPPPGYEPPLPPTTPGAAGDEWLVAVGSFPIEGTKSILWGATVTPVIRDSRSGPNEVNVTAAATPQTMRILGLPYSGETYRGTQLYTPRNGVSWELFVGSSLDGLTRWRFVVRDRIEVANGRVNIRAVGFVGGLTADRIIGAPERLNALAPSGETDPASGWVAHGYGTSFGTETGGPASDDVLWVTGTPDRLHYIEKTVSYAEPPHPWGRQAVAGLSYVKLPTGVDIDNYGLVTIAVFDTDENQLWPNDNGAGPDNRAGIVTSDMVRGSWITDHVIGIGYLPTPPFDVTIRLRLHPVDETAKVYYDGREIVRRENSSTVNPVDLTRHTTKLFNHFQNGRDKTGPDGASAWKIEVVEGDPVGIVEVGTWWHEDGQQGEDALEAVAGRGVDIYDLAGPGRKVMSTARRGAVRSDLIVHDWDVLGEPSWQIDVGALRTALRGTSSAGSIWGGADEGVINRAAAGGQVIDASFSGPVGMTPTQLREWLRQRGITLSVVPLTCSLPLRWQVGARLGVGDTVRVALQANAAAQKDWMKVTEWAPVFGRRFVQVTFGTDPELGVS